jgi:small subunit ribosomal protein S20
MPNSNSAKKRLNQNHAQRALNRSAKQAVRTQCRKVREAIEANDVDTAQAEFQLAVKSLDRAGSRRLIHPNAAARLKSRLSAKVKAIKQA